LRQALPPGIFLTASPIPAQGLKFTVVSVWSLSPGAPHRLSADLLHTQELMTVVRDVAPFENTRFAPSLTFLPGFFWVYL